METSNSTYTVLARRYRPQRFEDLIGQQHIARALKNAIAAGRVAHAYLFTGARGVGKTSAARILAKALNCLNCVDGEPCNQCELCHSISAGKDVDVLEIDGASNRGIDDIRSLRANVTVKSMRTRFKMYIIDEVHMLTKEAFNALLKTLEEPPPNVKFIFCTTEPHKLPDTILSRCQRFDFAAMANQQIIDRLTSITAQEGIEVDPDAIELVARRAGGSMRDSQSLFDQLLAFGQDRITSDDVNQLLGTAPDQRLIDFSTYMSTGQRDQLLGALDSALVDGVQIGNLADQIIYLFRDLMIIASGATMVPLLSVSEGRRDIMSQHASIWKLPRIVAALQVLAEAKAKMSRASQSRPYLELALIRISLLEDLQNIAALAKVLAEGKIEPLKMLLNHVNSQTPALTSQTPVVSQKKTPELAPDAAINPIKQTISAPLTPTSPASSSPAPNAASVRPLDTFSADEILAQLMKTPDEKWRSHLKSIHRCAISGPNHIDFLFSRRYNFSKEYLESKPELVNRLKSSLREITGQSLSTGFLLIDAQEDEAIQQSQKQQADLKNKDVIDSFASQIVEIFGARVTNKEALTPRKS